MLEEGIHIIVGSLGGGKTLRSIQLAEWFIRNNRRVATNVNIRLERLSDPDYYPSQVLRIPDKPTVDTLKHLGEGARKKGEYGLLLMDELGIWMNSRTFGDKDRLGVIRFLIEARKRRWIIIFILQKVSMMDKQARELGATIHTCRSTKNIFALKFLPKIHFVTVKNTLNVKAGATEFYRAKRLYGAYDTEQRFCETYHGNPLPISEDVVTYQPTSRLEKHYDLKNGYYSYLPSRLLKKSYVRRALKVEKQETRKMQKAYAVGFALLTLFLGLIFVFASDFLEEPIEALDEEALATVEPISNNGLINQNNTRVRESFTEYRNMTIRHHSRIGRKSNYHFNLPDGTMIDSQSLENRGFSVKDRGFNEALIIGPEYEFWSVYR
ncbi:zonular occludens toxin domain-containing protein [Nitrosomonas sp.]|uniref:zonular occludens toxin domain-containing protein n=1 Tax=Nitrosomonas sp. TaxID=42353 RepID=UPI0020839BBA|nr:zonular occludens toxin domain-containing protein [Nitrosomonas sp.]GJL76959.1 MAG: hypothetical protein NMNS02_30650 [Nitrosomonas sp.]